MKYSVSEVNSIIDAIDAQSYEPNEWEAEFMESILESGKLLSEKQSICLNGIYEKATGGGIARKEYFRR